MIRHFKKDTVKTMTFALAAFAVFAVFVYLFPYSFDDWAWGTQVGVDRLLNHFEGHNGRHAGNLLVMALTRSKLLNIVFTSATFSFLCVIPKKFADSEKSYLMPFAFMILLMMPKALWVQTVAWTAGFSNYVPSILLSFLYLVLVKNVFENQTPKYSKVLPVAAFVIGFVSALFMETVTLYNFVLSAAVIAYSLFKFKRASITYFAHFFGCVAGAVLMFSNSCYWAVAKGDDFYRTTALDQGIRETLEEHTKMVMDQFFEKNLWMLLIMTVLCIAVVIGCLNKDFSKFSKLTSALCAAANVGALIIIAHEKLFSGLDIAIKISEKKHNYSMFCAVLLYCVTVLLIVLLCVKDKNRKMKVLFALVSMPVLIAPLLVVNPVNSRCFFSGYFMGIVFCVLMLDYASDLFSMPKEVSYFRSVVFAAVSVAFAISWFSSYYPIHVYYEKREEYVQKQGELGYQNIVVCKIPNRSYVYHANPDSEMWGNRYKMWNGLDESVTLELMDYKDFDKWAKEFDKEVQSE